MPVWRVMASRKNDPVGGGVGEKQGSIEIAYVKLTGNDVTLQDAVRAFSGLINRAAVNGNVLSGAKRVNTLPAAPTQATNGNGHEPVASEDEAIDVDADETEATEQAAAPAGPRAARKYNVPTAISIDTETGTSVGSFVAQYKVDTHEDKYLALAGWLKAHRSQQPLKAGLIVTLYKHFDWTPPADVTMPLRRLSSKDYQWLERTSRGEYQIHQIGESKLAKLKA